MNTYHIRFKPEEKDQTDQTVPYNLLFKNGTSGLTAGDKMSGLIKTGDPRAAAFERVVAKYGFVLEYSRHGGQGKICCISTAFTGYLRVGEPRFQAALWILKAAWNGNPDSLRHEVLDSVIRFVDLYHNEYDPGRLICQLRSVDPMRIYTRGRSAGARLSGYRRFLYQIYLIYMGASQKYFLPRKF